MSCSKSSEDFWNTTFKSSFNFDEDDDDEYLAESFNEVLLEKSTVLPIVNIISKNSLDLLLDDVKSTNEYVSTPIEETIKKMINGHKFVLENYRTLEEKLALLDSAIETCDGNVILNIILFLKQTLKTNIFYMNLSKRKMALRHYISYLMLNNEFQGLIDLYMSSGNAASMKELCYFLLKEKNVNNSNAIFKELEKFYKEHLFGTNDNREIEQYMQFLEWQIKHKENSSTVVEQLAKLIKDHFLENKFSLEYLLDYKKQFKIDDFTFEWTIMNVLASMEKWEQINEYFIKTNWLTKKNHFKSTITTETFVNGLSKHKPPKNVISAYLPFINNSELRLYLAQKHQCHKFIIQTYINQDDRLALIKYKTSVPVTSEEFILIEEVLHSNRKWKN